MSKKPSEDPLATDLQRTGRLSKETLRQMVDMSAYNERGLGFELVFWGLLSDAEVISATHEAYTRMPFSASQSLFNAACIKGFPQEIATKYHCIPIAVLENACLIAFANSDNQQAIDEIETTMGSVVHVVPAEHDELELCIAQAIKNDAFNSPDSPELEGSQETRIGERATRTLVVVGLAKSTCVLAPSLGPVFWLKFDGKTREEKFKTPITATEGRALMYWFKHRVAAEPLDHSNPVGSFKLRVESELDFVFEFVLSKDFFGRDKMLIRFVDEVRVDSDASGDRGLHHGA